MTPLLLLILGSVFVFSYNATDLYGETHAEFVSGTSVSKVTLLNTVGESIFVILMLTSIITILLSDI